MECQVCVYARVCIKSTPMFPCNRLYGGAVTVGLTALSDGYYATGFHGCMRVCLSVCA